MRYFEFKLDDLCKAHGVDQGFFSCENEIINIQIGNDISKDWNYSEGDAVVVAVHDNANVRIYLKESADDTKYYETLKTVLNGVYHAFNSVFHYYVAKANFKEVKVKEVKPFKGKGCNRNWFFQKLIEGEQIKDIKLFDPIDDKDVPLSYSKYLQSGKEILAMDIVSHALACTMKDAVIMKHKQYFVDNFEVNNDGFLKS